jgi:hypothetical protein
MLPDHACPDCGSSQVKGRPEDGRPICAACGHIYAADRLVCTHCNTLNTAGQAFCGDCGEKLSSACPACGAENWAGADTCRQCGRELNFVQSLAQRHASGFRGALQQQRDSANALKAAEERDSQKRMAALWEVEKQRQDKLARDRARQQAQQNRTLLIVLIGGAMLVLALIGILALTAR